MIDLSICPSFSCNMNCRFCYLRHHDDRKLPILKLIKVLRNSKIRNLDIYGGEITCLPTLYSKLMMFVVDHYCYGKDIRFISNGLNIPPFWLKQFLKYNVGFSLDKRRSNRNVVMENIRSFDRLGKKYSILTVDIDDVDDKFIASLKNVESVSIKPYSIPIDGEEFESKMLYSYRRIYKENYHVFLKLEKTQTGRDNVRHLFLLPDGKLYDIQYRNNQEYFELADKCDQKIDNGCLTCEYFGKCFNEHYSGYRIPNTGDCLGRKEVMRFLDEIHNLH